ncbi:3-isopropylmalate dehydratase small subunit [bacterium]|nr:3-isopropylmalate dehydratase small subunit [bacterium]
MGKGKVYRCGRDINTDLILPARYMAVQDPEELKRYTFEDLDANFVKIVEKGDIVVADENFGSGSSREHAPIGIKASGIACVIAKSFARIFYRNAVNIGLPVFEMPDIVDTFAMGDKVEYDLQAGIIKNITKNMKFQAKPFSPEVQRIFDAGGLMNLVKQDLK